MVLQIHPAKATDVDRISTIHLLAFDTNPLLHAQFPIPASLTALHSILSRETLHAIQNSQDAKAILVVKDTELEEQDQIIAFAKWNLPSEGKVGFHEGVTWPQDCKQEWLDAYHELAEKAKERVIGGGKCYREFGLYGDTVPCFEGTWCWGLVLTLSRSYVCRDAAETPRPWRWDYVE